MIAENARDVQRNEYTSKWYGIRGKNYDKQSL